MNKIAWFVRFRADADRDWADQRWAHEHAELCLRLPGLVRYVQNRQVSPASLGLPGERNPIADGFSALWWPNQASLDAALRSPEWTRVTEDAAEIFDVDAPGCGVAEIEERVPRAGLGAKPDGVSTPGPGPIKSVGMLHYRRDLSRDDVNDHWVRTHGPIALTVEQIGHYTQNHALRRVDDGVGAGTKLAFDGFSEAWFADAATFESAMSSAGWQALSADGPNMFDLDAVSALFVEERVLRE